jgi:retron-type reverse transcriptase
MTKGNSGQTTGSQAQDWVNPLSGLDRIRQAARRDRGQRFTSLMHHLTAELLQESYRGLRKDAAAGVDEVTWREYEDGLTARVLDLHKRVQSGRYRAKPSKRIYLPKPDGRLRPIGIASLEDKIVQAAVVRVLEQIYEEDFLGFSYGYRPRRSQHHALDAVWVGINSRKINWILDADLRNFLTASTTRGCCDFWNTA